MRTIALMLLVWSVPGTTVADGPVVHGGVPVDALTPEGLERLSVSAPSAVGRPVRIVYGANDAPQVLMDVLVAADAPRARAAIEEWRRAVVRPPAPAALGDVGYGEGPLQAFARDNVFVAVHRVDGDADAAAIAAQADAAILAAPPGRPTADPVPVRRYEDGQSGAPPLPIEVPEGLLAAGIEVCGKAYARRTPEGWVLVRTGPGPVTVRVIGVDRMLRVTPAQGSDPPT
jgi:hypothetical protein